MGIISDLKKGPVAAANEVTDHAAQVAAVLGPDAMADIQGLTDHWVDRVADRGSTILPGVEQAGRDLLDQGTAAVASQLASILPALEGYDLVIRIRLEKRV